MAISMKTHMTNLHQEASRHHSSMSEHHGKLAAAAHGLAKCFGKAKEAESEHEHFTQMGKAHSAAAEEHQRLVEFHDAQAEACEKAAEGELQKLIPDRVSRVLPNNPGVTAVPRAGQQPIAAQPDMPLEFQRLFKVDEDDLMAT